MAPGTTADPKAQIAFGKFHPDGPDQESQAIPLYAHDKARPGDQIY